MSDNAFNATKPRGLNLGGAGQILGVFGALVVICVVATFVAPQFLTSYNLTIISRELAFIGLVAIAQGLLLLLGDIDVSIGAIAGLAGIVCTKLLVDVDLHPVLAITAGLLVGALAGAMNGFIVTLFNLNSLVVTIGMLSVYSGVSLFITKGRTIVGLAPDVTFLGGGSLMGVPIPVYIMLAVFLIILFVTTKTIYGRRLYAVGNSREAAKIVGINQQKIRITAFAIAGALAGLAGMLLCFRLVSAQASMGQSWLLPSIAAPSLAASPPQAASERSGVRFWVRRSSR
ncbi:ABC transporter permease [Ruegeria sp. SCPT10]|uniref:ABC transporter permease n=1 Tax=Ruegeria sp. SCP10 TaxID=3141377 RepID=UPI003336D840